MFKLQSIRGTTMSLTMCAIALALLFAFPSFSRPDAAQAQFCNGSGFSVAGGSSCNSYGGYGGYNGCGSSLLNELVRAVPEQLQWLVRRQQLRRQLRGRFNLRRHPVDGRRNMFERRRELRLGVPEL
jgi:hypothetical protein